MHLWWLIELRQTLTAKYWYTLGTIIYRHWGISFQHRCSFIKWQANIWKGWGNTFRGGAKILFEAEQKYWPNRDQLGWVVGLGWQWPLVASGVLPVLQLLSTLCLVTSHSIFCYSLIKMNINICKTIQNLLYLWFMSRFNTMTLCLCVCVSSDRALELD